MATCALQRTIEYCGYPILLIIQAVEGDESISNTSMWLEYVGDV